MIERYTTVGVCLCGCEQARVDHVQASSVPDALQRARRCNKARGVYVVAVFKGELDNELGCPERMPAAS